MNYYNENFLITFQYDHWDGHCNNIYVWKWMEYQNPKYLYTIDFIKTYPTNISHYALFLWKRYLVLMPDTVVWTEGQSFTSMIRVHDLDDNLKLVGSYDFPEKSPEKR